MEGKVTNMSVSNMSDLVTLFFSVSLMNSQFSKEEILYCFASLLYARKSGSLLIIPKNCHTTGSFLCLCSSDKENKTVCIDINKNQQSTKNQKFLELLDQYYGSLVFQANSSYMYELCQSITNSQFEDGEYLEAFDYMLHFCGTDKLVTIPQSDELVELISLLLGDKIKSVFDPFGGLMTLESKLGCQRFVAFEENYSLWVKGFFRLALAGKLDNGEFNWGKAKEFKGGGFDAIISIPPIGISRPSINMNNDVQVLNSFEDFTHGEGKLITVMPLITAISDAQKFVEFRKKFLQNNFLDCLIQLPTGLNETTNVGTMLVVLKKNRKEDTPIRIIDATSFVKKDHAKSVLDVAAVMKCYDGEESDFSMSIDSATIIDNNASWRVRWYLYEKKQEFTEGFVVEQFSELLDEVKGAEVFNDKTGHVVDTSALERNELYYDIKPDTFPPLDTLEKTRKITEPVILFTKGFNAKPAFCNASISNPIFIKSLVVAYRIKKDSVHEGYLCMELEKRLKEFNEVVGFYGYAGLLGNISLEFPSLDKEYSYREQKKLFELAQSAARVERVKRLGLESLLEQNKKEYMEEVRLRKHDMKTPMAQLRSSLKLLDSLANQLTGEPSIMLREYIQGQRKALDVLSEIVRHIADEEVFATPEPVDLGEVLSSCQTSTDKYVIVYYPDEAVLKEARLVKPMVMMGKTDLLRLVQNIIGNAIERGFVDAYPEYLLNISLTVKDGFYIIDFSNNGRPLPEGMTKERYGMKGVRGKGSNGEGKGGYIVKSVTEHYGGDYDVYSQQFAGMWFTHVIVKLPIYHDNE